MRIFKEVCAQIAAAAKRLLATSRALAHLDVVAALAEVARQNNYSRPSLSDDNTLEIINSRHPVVETMPLLDADGVFCLRCLPVAGGTDPHHWPRMSGKSTLRQVALIVLMAQIGSFVPAAGRIGLVDRILPASGRGTRFTRRAKPLW
jgi:DNA mismatch repair protein MutS